MSTEGSGASSAGGDGFHNEDAFLVEEGLGLYVVCDGASESPAGELAARIARDAVAASVRNSEHELDVRHARVARFVVEKAMGMAIRELTSAEQTDPALRGLSTTLTLLLAHRDTGIIGHRGDSRAYLIRNARSRQLTVDHELTEALENVGKTAEEFDVFTVELVPGDTIVLCTDGAEQTVDDATIARTAASLSPRILASRIVSAARRLDPALDATAVVVRVRGERERGWLEISEETKGTSFGHTLERGDR